MVRSLVIIWLQISCRIRQWKNLENRLRFDKVITKSLMLPLFWDTVYMTIDISLKSCIFMQSLASAWRPVMEKFVLVTKPDWNPFIFDQQRNKICWHVCSRYWLMFSDTVHVTYTSQIFVKMCIIQLVIKQYLQCCSHGHVFLHCVISPYSSPHIFRHILVIKRC